MHIFRLSLHVIIEAFYRFNRDDGWAIASHISLSVLLSVFPFLIVVTAIAGFVGSVNLADEVARLMFAVWPQQVATPIAAQIHNVLTTAHGGVLTLGAVFSVYFASSGVESLRIGLNRGVHKMRSDMTGQDQEDDEKTAMQIGPDRRHRNQPCQQFCVAGRGV